MYSPNRFEDEMASVSARVTRLPLQAQSKARRGGRDPRTKVAKGEDTLLFRDAQGTPVWMREPANDERWFNNNQTWLASVYNSTRLKQVLRSPS